MSEEMIGKKERDGFLLFINRLGFFMVIVAAGLCVVSMVTFSPVSVESLIMDGMLTISMWGFAIIGIFLVWIH